ncbi:hypothetical protein [Halorubrum trueperi]|uniref:DUF58 domain-containing protein n=1 Tax=Halorubrum trueperi TaxID=2004704 RepID=A0ABD5UM51_9EURY
MRRVGAWSFTTVRGRVHVAPDELRVHRKVTRVARSVPRALAAGRFPRVVRSVGWTGILAVMTLASAAPGLIFDDVGTGSLFLPALSVLTAIGGVAVAVARNRRTAIPLDDVDHVAFEDGALVIVHADGDDGDGDEGEKGEKTGDGGGRDRTRVRPLDDDERADAALALRLRGVDLRGVEDDDAVSRTVVDVPKTELVA